MAQRQVRCGCGAEFPIPEIPPTLLHCPRCGHRMTFGSPDGGAVKVREDIREPIRPLPPSRPWFPLLLLMAAGLLIAGGLAGAVFYFTKLERPLHPHVHEGVRAQPRVREEEPVISLREIPVLPETPKPAAETVVIPPRPPPEPSEPKGAASGPLAKAQQLCVRANLAGLVLTILTHTGRVEDAREVDAELARTQEEIRALLAPLGDRAEVRSFKDSFRPGDELTGFGIVALDPLHPVLFAEAVRSWLLEAQGGALAVATIVRGGRTRTLSMWFPEFPLDLLQRVQSGPQKRSK